MTITSIRLQNYRSYQDSSFEFEPGVNIIVGPNASGKTNLLDAIYYSCTGKPIHNPKRLINENKPWARVDVLTSENNQRTIKIKENQSPTIYAGQKEYKRLPISSSIPVVLFEPNHLYYINSSPDMRRQLVDEILSKTDQEFVKIKNNYTRILRQRNTLLKQNINIIKKQIFAWDVRLSEEAGKYVQKRKDLIDIINKDLSTVYSQIANKKNKLTIVYNSKNTSKEYSSGMLKSLQKNLELDHLRGFTSFGPHRDDISIKINNNDMHGTASRGETRSILLSIKVIEASILQKHFLKKPLLLLDDVFGELDGSRRKSLIEFISANQTFITTTDADIIGHKFIQKANIIYTN